ncbi:MAG: DUF5686 and carboxypeptidase regulatory-like domain-containing protein [Cyclobacteriaceae bacterium]
MKGTAKAFITLFTILLASSAVNAQGIRGTIYNDQNEVLPFATIYVRSTESGAISNIDGYYEIQLTPGKYDIVYQYLGYESLIKVVEVTNSFSQLDIKLKAQAVLLREVVVTTGKEDPAFTIMRKAIAKAKYHTNQLDAYTARVYVKGSGRLIDSPFFLRKKIAKEGIDSTSAFTQESVIEVKYTRPNQYEEHVLSIRTSGESHNTSPAPYINGSFYEPEIGQAVSPLSPRAFAYYRFSYQGSFEEQGYVVSKIRVTPRSKGDNVFEGDLLIVEDQWSIHSLDLKTTTFGIGINISQIYNPISGKAWMPVSHKFDVRGSFLGFDFEFNYLATASNYEITLNPDLSTEFEVIDDKVEKELAQQIEEDNKNIKQPDVLEKLQTGKAMTRKDLRKVIREYEKQEREKQPEPDVIEIRKTSIDSMAYKNDSTYWAGIRSVPLNEYEIKGYKKLDSMAVEDAKAAKGDTTKTGRKKGFGVGDLLLGNTYKVGNKTHLKLKNSLETLGFNTVEGFNFQYGLQLTKTFENKQWLSIEPTVRYSFAREKLIGNAKVTWKWTNNTNWIFAGGREINQYSDQNPIHPMVNSLTTLLYKRNYMKLYEQDFATIKFNQRISDKLRFSVSSTWAERHQLFNNTSYTLRDRKDVVYTPNPPFNDELVNTVFETNQAITTDININYIPAIRYRLVNGAKEKIDGVAPTFTARLRNGLPVQDSDVDFNLLSFGVKHNFKMGIRGRLFYQIDAGLFLNKEKLTFVDYQHFLGNQIFVQNTDPVGRYRLLDYYQSSTADHYISSFTYYNFRKLLITHLGFVQKWGLKEGLFVNYLGTQSSGNYTEVGYSLNNIYRFFRIEGIASFRDGEYSDWGLRVGISTSLFEMVSIN